MTSPVGSSGPVGSFPGIGSTFDYTKLVNQLIQIQSQPDVAMQARITSAQAQLIAYQSYSGLLSNLETATSPMRSSASNVTASIVTDSSNAQRLVLTSTQTRSTGINLVDGAQGVTLQLGWIDATSSINTLQVPEPPATTSRRPPPASDPNWV